MKKWKGRFRAVFSLFVFLTGFGLTGDLDAQALDSMQLKIGTIATVASQEYQPLWLVSNRWSSIADQQADVSSYLTFRNKHRLGRENPINAYLRRTRSVQEKSVSYGLSVYNNHLFQETFLQEAYIKIRLNHWQLAAGRVKEIVGEVDPLLSSGSLGISGNALPIPKISLGTPEYTDFPFLESGTLQFKGQLSHGWMEREAFVKNAMFHQRSFYLRLGRKTFKKFTPYGGLNQFIIWGGQHPDHGQLWNDPKDLFKFVTPGNNLGFFDYGFSLLTRDYKFKVYSQVPFEGRSSISIFRVKDRLLGFALASKNQDALLSRVALELINTTWVDPNPEKTNSHNDYNFYNNERYQTGWHYAGNIIGTPLFFDRQRAMHYFGDFSDQVVYDWNIANNRINGMHLALKGSLPVDGLSYRTLLTHTINHGNYYNKELFAVAKNQTYLIQEFNYQYEGLKLNAALGADVGGLTNNVGGMLGIEYDFTHKPDTRHLGPVKFRKKKNLFKQRRYRRR